MITQGTVGSHHKLDADNRIEIEGHVVIIYNKGMKMYLLHKKRRRRQHKTVFLKDDIYIDMCYDIFIL